jgi:hypothetical protein
MKPTIFDCPKCGTKNCTNNVDCINVNCMHKFDKHDVVNNPQHYTSGGIECIDALQAALTQDEFIGFLKGNVIKYNWRCNHKGGVQDLEKAKWYLDKLIKVKRGAK